MAFCLWSRNQTGRRASRRATLLSPVSLPAQVGGMGDLGFYIWSSIRAAGGERVGFVASFIFFNPVSWRAGSDLAFCFRAHAMRRLPNGAAMPAPRPAAGVSFRRRLPSNLPISPQPRRRRHRRAPPRTCRWHGHRRAGERLRILVWQRHSCLSGLHMFVV